MHDLMKKLLEKKAGEGKMLSDNEKDAKMSVLGDLKSHMDHMLSEKVGGLKKVSVMSDSKPGLDEGLKKARELIAHGDEQPDHGEHDSENELLPGEGQEDEGSEQEEMSESPDEEMSEQEADRKIAELQAHKEKLKAKKA